MTPISNTERILTIIAATAFAFLLYCALVAL